jgi:hypothetical protein
MTDNAFQRATELLLQTRSDPDDDDVLLNQSIELFRVARSMRMVDPGAVAANLGVALRMLAERTGDRAIAKQAVAEAQAAVDAQLTSGRYLNLANALHVQFLITDDDTYLAKAIEAARAAVHSCDDELHLPMRLASLAGLLLDRAGRAGTDADEREALELTKRAFGMPTPEDDFWQVVANNRMLALRMAYQREFDPDLAEQSIALGQAMLANLAPGSADRSSAAGNLGLVLLSRYGVYHHEPDLDAAVELLTVAARDPGPLRHRWLANLVIVRTEQYQRDPQQATFERLEAAGQAALRELSGNDAHRGPVLVNLGAAHIERFERTGEAGALDVAERLYREAIELTADRPAHQSLAYSGLAVVWQRKAGVTADADLLSQAIELGHELISHPFASVTDRAIALSNLGLALADRFAATGDVEIVAEAAARLGESVEALPPGHTARLGHLSNLAVLLLSWAEATGEQRVADEAVTVASDAVEAGGDHPDRIGHLANLGGALWRRYVRTGDPAALERAAQATHNAVTATPVGHPDRARYLSNLSGMLARQSESETDSRAVREAVRCAKEAVDLTPVDHPDRPLRLSNFGLVLRYQWQYHGVWTALDDAVRALRQAVATLSAGHHALPGRLSNLAATLLLRYERDRADVDRIAAAELFHKVARHDVAPVSLRVQAAVQTGQLAADQARWPVATEEFELAVQLMQRLATHYTDRVDEEHELARFAHVSSDAGACALHANDARLALELLELGTGIMLARTLELRSDLADLGERFPAMAKRLDLMVRAIVSDDTFETGVAATTLHGIRRRHVDLEWRTLIDDIRRLPGFEQFQLPPSDADLRHLAERGTIVVVNASKYRCDALLVTADGGVRSLPLPDLTHSDVVAAAQSLSTVDPADDPRSLHDLLAWLWDSLAAPVLAIVRTAQSPSGQPSRLWWMPIGVLALLPIHAAGHPGGPYVDDYVVSSYTPTLGSLRHHRAQAAATEVKALIIDAPKSGDPLPAARTEATRVADLLAARTVLPGSEADTAHVLSGLASHGWVHFSGHAAADLDRPSRSHLLLADGPLSVADLATRHLTGQVAVLSACSSTRTRTDLAAEAVHIAAAFHLAGFRQVVGTLWPVADRVSLRMAKHLYPAVLDDGRLDPERLPEALRAAVRSLRARWPDRPAAWASYLHLGC